MPKFAPRIVVLTGAGVSAESGVPTFRGADGLWEGHRVGDLATPEAFEANPDLVHHFYNQRRAAIRTKEPNAAHQALARLEACLGERFLLVTQNVDDLHDRAGSRPLHMHGELRKARCDHCGAVVAWDGDLGRATPCPQCRRPGGMRPHIVWFGEMPFHMDEIQAAIGQCDVFAAIGTSSLVYPAAGFADLARECGAHCIEFNLEPTDRTGVFHEHRSGPAATTVPAWVEEVLAAESRQ